MTEIGQKYFGFKNFDNKNYTWHFEDANQFVLKSSKEEKKYDLIITDINNINQTEGISPPPVFFDDGYLKAIHVRLLT